MEQYIPKTAVLAEIENLLDKGKYHEEYDCAYRDGNNGALYALKGKLDAIEVKEMQEESVSDDLEEASRNYTDNEEYGDDVYFAIKAAFEAGAEWKKEHLWKPSEEMLEALYRVIPENVMAISEDEMLLDKLYQGLKYGRVLSKK